MLPGSGKIDINGRSFEDYFPTAPLQKMRVATAANGKARECI
jgi:ribosomal protein S9